MHDGSRRLVTAAVLGAALIGVVAGCGDDDTASGPSKTQFVEQADLIFCDQLGGVRDEIGSRTITSDPPTAAELAAFSAEFGPIYREHIAAFRALTPPEGDELVAEAIALAADVIADGLDLAATEPAFADAMVNAEQQDLPGRTQLDQLGEAYGVFNCD